MLNLNSKIFDNNGLRQYAPHYLEEPASDTGHGTLNVGYDLTSPTDRKMGRNLIISRCELMHNTDERLYKSVNNLL